MLAYIISFQGIFQEKDMLFTGIEVLFLIKIQY